MAVDTLLVAVGERDETNTEAMIDAVRTLAAPETRASSRTRSTRRRTRPRSTN